MKIQTFLLILSLAISFSVASAGETPAKVSESTQSGIAATNGGLTAFDLDFPGGTPRELVAAIRKATGIPLNVIVPDELAKTQLPGLKMKDVNIPQLFQALEASSRRTEVYSTAVYGGGAGGAGGYKSYQQMNTSYGFKTEGTPKTDSIWYFYVQNPSLPPGSSVATRGKECRFYPLGPYLSREVTVDDITTAISSGWKMMGESSPPAIKFHKETKLLIAVGDPRALQTIDAVLKALESPKSNTAPAGPGTPAEKTDKTKADE